MIGTLWMGTTTATGGRGPGADAALDKVMTALATIAGMLPLAFAIGAGSQMLQPLAIAVIGGVLVSMVLSLVITPAVHFYLSGRNGEGHAKLAPVAN